MKIQLRHLTAVAHGCNSFEDIAELFGAATADILAIIRQEYTLDEFERQFMRRTHAKRDLMMEEVNSWVAHDVPLSKGMKSRVGSFLDDSQIRLKLLMMALAKNRVSRLTKLLERISLMEERMYSADMIYKADPYLLLRMLQTAESVSSNAITFLQELASGDSPLKMLKSEMKEIMDDVDKIDKMNLSAIPPASREKIRAVVDVFYKEFSGSAISRETQK